MTQERLERIAAEVMDSLKMADSERQVAIRYVRRAVTKILLYCNREDFPVMLEDTAAQIAEDMIRADLITDSSTSKSRKDVASIKRGDTAITYKDDSSIRRGTVDFMRNYEVTLNRYKKMNLPKDVRR